MIYQSFNLNRYNWNIHVCYGVGEEDLNEIKHLLHHFYFNDNITDICYNNISKQQLNTGFTCTNRLLHKTLICINKCSSPDKFINTVAHEINHLKSHIATVFNLNEKEEEVCYLVGDITETMFYCFKNYL